MLTIADAGIPMLAWQLPAAMALFFPIVVVESFIVWRVVKLPLWPVVIRVAAANAFSSFIGIPMAWLGMVVISMFSGGYFNGYDTPWAAFKSIVLQAAWLVPDEPQLFWLIPAATLVLLVPYFFVSVFTERWILAHKWKNVPPHRIRLASWLANATTYAGLAILCGYWLYCDLSACYPAH